MENIPQIFQSGKMAGGTTRYTLQLYLLGEIYMLKLEQSECKNNVKVKPGWQYKLLSDEGLLKGHEKPFASYLETIYFHQLCDVLV